MYSNQNLSTKRYFLPLLFFILHDFLVTDPEGETMCLSINKCFADLQNDVAKNLFSYAFLVACT